MPGQMMAFDAQQVARYEALFADPSPEAMHALEPHEFEWFVAYVFFCAGYQVEYVAEQRFPNGPGVDLNLYGGEPGAPLLARVEARRYKPSPDRLIELRDIAAFMGMLEFAGGAPGYLITTSDFNANARVAARLENAEGKLRLVNGADLCRYVTYIRGSRIRDAQGNVRTPAPTAPDWLIGSHDHAPRSNAFALTITNNKGGVAKTTTTLNLGMALAQQGKRVLLVDVDGQGSLTADLPLPAPAEGARRRARAPLPRRDAALHNYFSGEVALATLVQPTRFERVWLLPSHPELHRMDTGGGARPDAELAFMRALHSPELVAPTVGAAGAPQSLPFEWILIDTPSAQSFYTRIALAACDAAIIPINVEAFALNGISGAFETAKAMRALVSSNADAVRMLGCVITRWKSNANARRELTEIRAQLPRLPLTLFQANIPFDERIEQAHVAIKSGGIRHLFGFANGVAAMGYNDLRDELLAKVGSQ